MRLISLDRVTYEVFLLTLSLLTDAQSRRKVPTQADSSTAVTNPSRANATSLNGRMEKGEVVEEEEEVVVE